MLLSIIIFLPLLAAVLVAIAKFLNVGDSVLKGIAFLAALLTFVISVSLYLNFDLASENEGMKYYVDIQWIEGLGINYQIGIDGISLWIVLLTTFLTPICILASWNSVEKSISGFMIALLVLETAMIGVFCALDMFLFFVFWESILIPMYFLIGIWGGRRRIYATIKFVLYTMVGSALMFVGILYLYFQNNNSFDLLQLYGLAGSIAPEKQKLLFLAFFIAFAIKAVSYTHLTLPTNREV